MEGLFSRTELLLGEDAMKKLVSSRVAVFGIGGVGGYAVEALARCGVGALDLIDHDTIAASNINRQIIATEENIGALKTDVAAKRIALINSECQVTTYPVFFLPENEGEFDFRQFDYIIDAVDTVSAKFALIEKAKREGTNIISSMGAGNKLDPTAFQVADIYDTSVCPLARVIRAGCRKRGINHLKVVFSKEKPIHPYEVGLKTKDDLSFSQPPGSVSFVPSVVGLILAGEVIKDLIGIKKDHVRNLQRI